MSSRLRRNSRVEFEGFCELSWNDRYGNRKWFKARGINLSATGVQVVIPEPVDLGVGMSARADQYGLACRVSVQNCRRVGRVYHLGLEFTGGYRWQPPPGSFPALGGESEIAEPPKEPAAPVPPPAPRDRLRIRISD